MAEEELQIHGSMFFLLKKFIENNYGGSETWLKLNEVAGISRPLYEPQKNYPLAEMFAILSATAIHSRLSQNKFTEKFGEYLVSDLLNLYKSHLNPSWKTFEILENTELIMHKAVRKQEKNANPPILNVSRVHDKLIIIDYYSKRKMASLAVGIIKGIAGFYNEKERVRTILNTHPNDERVQIRIEFK
jgi:hypothetical protein